MRRDQIRFAAFILTHGRPDNQRTLTSLRRSGFTGAIYLVLDDEDSTIGRYRERYGDEMIKVFDKKAVADAHDEGNNFDNRKVIVHARNACFDIAEDLGLTHFIQLDDDYTNFSYRSDTYSRVITDIDRVFDLLLDFFESTPTKSIAFSQGGDHIGGFIGLRMKRKCMNSFICSMERRFTFLGSINEDINTYTRLGSTGDLFLTFFGLQLNQVQTQQQSGGMTDIYLERGTYIKSFSTVLYSPSCVKVAMMSAKNKRLHHLIDWPTAVPQIISDSYRKQEHSHATL